MRVYDYHCKRCNTTTEEFVRDHTVDTIECAICGGTADRLICAPRFSLDPNDPAGFPSAYAKWDKDRRSVRQARLKKKSSIL